MGAFGMSNTGGLANRHHPPKTQCKICWCSIFPQDDTVWVRTPSPGLAHKTCAEPKEPETKD